MNAKPDASKPLFGRVWLRLASRRWLSLSLQVEEEKNLASITIPTHNPTGGIPRPNFLKLSLIVCTSVMKKSSSYRTLSGASTPASTNACRSSCASPRTSCSSWDACENRYTLVWEDPHSVQSHGVISDFNNNYKKSETTTWANTTKTRTQQEHGTIGESMTSEDMRQQGQNK